MKTYQYDEYDPDGGRIVTITEDEIIEKYWDYWCEQMRRVRKSHMIFRENCIDDFIVVYWAWEVKNEDNIYE